MLFIIFVQICNLIWRNVIVYLDLITSSPYLLCVHLNYQHTEVSFNWTQLSKHLKVRGMYSIPRNDSMWKQTLLCCSLLSPPLQSKAFLLFKRGTQSQSFTISNGKKDLAAPWESNKGQSLPYYWDFSQYANTDILPHTRKVLLLHISWCSPFPSSDASQICLGELWILLAQKVHYNYRWIIRPKDQTRISPKQNPLY